MFAMASGDGLTPIDRMRLAAMIALHEDWAGWQQARTEVLCRAAIAVQTRLLTVVDVCKALGISRDTYYRHMKALRPVRGSELFAELAAQVASTLVAAGLDENTTLDDIKNDPDLELALSTIGVHHRAAPPAEGEDR